MTIRGKAAKQLRRGWGWVFTGVAFAAGVVTVLAYIEQHNSKPPAAPATAPEPGAVDFRGGDNNGGGVFIENSPINGVVPKVRGGNGGPNGAGGPVRIDNSPMTPPTPAR